MAYQLTTLPNYLRIATEEMPGVESVAVSVAVGVGSRYEKESENGLSHILEHMAFKGTKTRTARQIAEAFEDIGGQFNAYTSVEQTVYYARVLADYMPRALELLADILQHSTIDEEELEREKHVTLQEIAMHHDTPEDVITDMFDSVAYPNQAMGRPILGNEKRIKEYTRDDVISYMNQHYHAPRMVVSVAGKLKHDEVLHHVNQHFHLASGKEFERSVFEPACYQGGAIHTQKDIEQTHIMLGYHAVPLGHPDFYTVQLLGMILGGGMSSRLFQEIREKRGLAYQVSSYISAYSDTGMLLMTAASNPAHTAEIPKLMTHELEQLSKYISTEELTRAKNQQITELAMARENTSAVAGWIGRHLLIYGNYITLDQLKQRIRAVTPEHIQHVAKQLLVTTPTLATLGN